MTAGRKRITLCADDFALSESISQGIVSLIKKQRLSATSCMTTEARWQQDAPLLTPLVDLADIGLHFNLTEGCALSVNPFNSGSNTFSGLGSVMRDTLMRKVSVALIQKELNAQMDAFVEAMGCLPAFIDGHQHIHHLPLVRTALLEVYKKRFSGSRCYMRAISPIVGGYGSIFTKQKLKEWVISLTGAIKMRSLLQQQNIPCNTGFAGIYDFSDVEEFPQMMQYWLSAVSDGALVMCHPGLSSDEYDVLSDSRPKEFAYLQSDAFILECEKNDITLSRFSASTIN